MAESTNQRMRRQREQMHFRQKGLCHWCKKPTRLLQRGEKEGQPPFDMATIDHLDDRYSAERGKHPGTFRRVMACWKCNHDRNVERQRGVPIEELRARAGQQS